MADGPAGFAQGFTCPALLRIPLSITVFARTGLSPSTAPLSRGLRFIAHRTSWSYNPAAAETAAVWADPLSLATTHGITLVFFSSGYLDVSVHRVRPPCGVLYLQYSGLPHSDTRGSHRMCRSPRIFAAYRVLRRLWEPRHPPYALIQLVARPFNIIAGTKKGTACCVSSFSVRQDLDLVRTLSQYVNELFRSRALCTGAIVENIGVEPMASCVQGRRSSQLS